MAKVYLSPAYHYFNACAIAGCDETTHNNLYLDQLEPFLDACGIEWKRGPRRVPKSNEDANALMKQAVKESDEWGADVHYISHTNAHTNTATDGIGAGTAKGYRPIIYTGSTRGEKLAKYMIARRKEVYSGPVTLNRRSDLYELRVPAAVSYYEEHVFHDNPAEAQWFHDHLKDVARSAAKGFCDHFNIPFVEPNIDAGTPAPETAPVEEAKEVCTVELSVLRKGSEGNTVKALQLLLIGNGYSCGSAGADGDFGNGTLGAVKNYQQAKGLTPDGVVGAKTWKRLLT